MPEITAAEQLLIELVNRARLDPLAEAGRFGIDLNQGLDPGQLGAGARQVLAPNALLHQAAEAHAQWMLDQDIFSHTGAGGSAPHDRMEDAGYAFTGSWTSGENIAWVGSTGAITLNGTIEMLHRNLFLSAGHRVNILNDAFRELGVGQEAGAFASQGTTYNAAMLAENFARSGTAVFLTGVAYTDLDGNGAYGIGEGTGGVTFTSGGISTGTGAAGGYALALAAGLTEIGIIHGGQISAVRVDLGAGNVKLDLVGDDLLLSSGSLRLGGGVEDARLLGVAALSLTGTAAANDLTGNAGRNVISGLAGADRITGAAGHDRLLGGGGADRLIGGAGRDRLDGGAGNDILTGGGGADSFVFRAGGGRDRITDFSLAQNDILRLSDALWDGDLTATQVVSRFAALVGGQVVFDFDDGSRITLAGVGSLQGLADQIELF